MREMDLLPGDFQFTRGWFRNRNLATFRSKIYPQFNNKPTVYLELGVFEGMSMVWMMQHVLTHPDSRAVGVDTWLQSTKLSEAEMDAVRQRALHNVAGWHYPTGDGAHWKCQLTRGCSAEVLRRMQGRVGYLGIKSGAVDLCMIDGDHNELAVLDDMVQVYQLLKRGGWMLMDDVENDHTKQGHVKHGIARYFNEHPGTLGLLWKDGYVECYQKL